MSPMRSIGMLTGLAAMLALFGTSGQAQQRPGTGMITVGQPASWRVPTAPARVTGLGSARFGMSEAQARAAVAADFGPDAATRLRPDSDERGPDRNMLATTLPWLTDAVPARIAFTFVQGRLVKIDIDWAVAERASPSQRAALVEVARQVTANLYESSWPMLSTRRGRRIGENAVLVFAAEDVVGSGVEVSLFNVDFSLREGSGSRTVAAPAESGVLLRVTYAEDIFGRYLLGQGEF